MADFKETLEVQRNDKCFLGFSWCWTKEDLAVSEDTDVDTLSNPPMEIEFESEASLAEVVEKIESFCDKEDKVFQALANLRDYGRIRLVDEY